jgi:hypothetical protein
VDRFSRFFVEVVEIACGEKNFIHASATSRIMATPLFRETRCAPGIEGGRRVLKTTGGQVGDQSVDVVPVG